jgi:hypothetical protein
MAGCLQLWLRIHVTAAELQVDRNAGAVQQEEMEASSYPIQVTPFSYLVVGQISTKQGISATNFMYTRIPPLMPPCPSSNQTELRFQLHFQLYVEVGTILHRPAPPFCRTKQALDRSVHV